jgi:isopropylmalate/homocitrate/citramalate synthase
VGYYRSRLPAQSARTGRIHVRVADPFDAFDEDPEGVMRAFKHLGALPISGILFEDVRGSRFTFESNEIIRLARHYNPCPRRILVHPHSGNGLEDAATIDAILAGADGLWSGFTPHAAQGAHGSVMMFLSNLLRAGNPHVREMYRMSALAETAEAMWQIHDRGPIPPTQPVVGERAYRYVDQYFEQTDLPCDLDPALVGREPGYEIMPAWAPNYIIGKRLAELGYGVEVAENDALHRMMRILMNRAQVEGRHIRFDDAEELAKLVDWAEAERRTTNLDLDAAPATSVLASRYR